MRYPRIAPVPLQYCTYIQFFEQENKENKENKKNKKGKPIMVTEIYTMSNPNMMAAMGRLDSADLTERLGLDKNVDKTTFLNELHTRFDAGLIDDQPTLKLMATLIDRGLMMDYVNGQIVKVEWPEPEPESQTDPFEQSDAIAASILSLIDGNAHPEPDDDSDDTDDTDDTDDDDYYDDDDDEDDDDDDDGNEYSPSYLDDRHNTDNDVTNTGDTDDTDKPDNTDSTNNETPSETKANGVSNIRVHIHADNDAELDAKLKAVLDLIDNMMASR